MTRTICGRILPPVLPSALGMVQHLSQLGRLVPHRACHPRAEPGCVCVHVCASSLMCVSTMSGATKGRGEQRHKQPPRVAALHAVGLC